MAMIFLIQKRKGIILLVLFLCVFCLIKGQQFNKTYIEDRPLMLFSSVLAKDTGYIVIGTTFNNYGNYYFQQSLVANIDLNGDMRSYVAAPDDTLAHTGVFWNTLMATEKENYAFSGYGFDTTQHLLFGFVNSSFDSVEIFRYHTPNTYAFQGIKTLQYDGNSFYITGVHTPIPGRSNVVLVKIDSLSNRIWEKYYDTGNYEYAKSICKLVSTPFFLQS